MEGLTQELKRLKERAHEQVTRHILPYWLGKTQDDQFGGFIGRIDGQNQKHPTDPKGLVLNARILWTFSAALHLSPEDEAYERAARRAFGYLESFFDDAEFGGGFWLVDYLGRPLDTKKLTYAQAFWLYGLSEYALSAREPGVKEKAGQLFTLLEERTKDPAFGGYFEGFDRAWTLDESERLSEKDAIAPKSSNTMLHVLEAYTAFLKLTDRDDVRTALRDTLCIFLDHIIDPDTYQMHLAFDRAWNPVTTAISYGHDIEASWLLVDAARLLDDPELYARTVTLCIGMANKVLMDGLANDGSVIYARSNGTVDGDRHWWTQAEGVVGLLNAYQLTRDPVYASAAIKVWDFIETHLVDYEHGEWLYRVDNAGNTYPEDNKVGPWKCPYHNTRCCFEIIARLGG